jgi:hypothetical protein
MGSAFENLDLYSAIPPYTTAVSLVLLVAAMDWFLFITLSKVLCSGYPK